MSESVQPATAPSSEITLSELDGANPLGFLAAIGTLCVLAEAKAPVHPTLTWASSNGTWVPVIRGRGNDKTAIAKGLADVLRCPFQTDEQLDRDRSKAQDAHDQKKKELKAAADALKPLKLRGEKLLEAQKQRLGPIRAELATLRIEWLSALRRVVPSLELSLGKHLNASCSELRDTMQLVLDETSAFKRTATDLLAAFGSDGCGQAKTGQMQATPFCFTTGSGHQNFLDTARHLLEKVTDKMLEAALFFRAEPSDETLSMRWSPQEDRRYAVMWSDPGKVDKPKTNWAINLLGYRGLQLISSVPCLRDLQTTGWRTEPDQAWRWPVWKNGLSVDVIRSLLSHPLLAKGKPRRERLSVLGISALFESARIEVGKPPNSKINFSPAVQLA